MDIHGAKGCAEDSKALRVKIANIKPLYMRRRGFGGQEESVQSPCRLSNVVVFGETSIIETAGDKNQTVKVPLGVC